MRVAVYRSTDAVSERAVVVDISERGALADVDAVESTNTGAVDVPVFSM